MKKIAVLISFIFIGLAQHASAQAADSLMKVWRGQHKSIDSLTQIVEQSQRAYDSLLFRGDMEKVARQKAIRDSYLSAHEEWYASLSDSAKRASIKASKAEVECLLKELELLKK